MTHTGDSAASGGIRPLDPQASIEPVDPERERRTERLIAVNFIVSFLGTVALAVVYWQGGQPQAEGILLGVIMGALGIGLTAWGKYLLPQGPFVQDREELSSTPKEREGYELSLERGVGDIRRRSFLGKLLAMATGAFGIVAIFPFVRSLGPQPKKALTKTSWNRGSLLVRSDGTPVHIDSLEIGGMMTVFPQHDSNAAISQTLLVRPSAQAFTTKPGRETWTPKGYVAFSKVCTHAGCPVALYEQQTQQLLCPCHQSLFNIFSGATPVFGPAPRPLPQLPLYIDSQGNLRAQAGYDEPIGPGYWERGA